MANAITWQNLDTLSTSTGAAYIQGKINDVFFDAHPFLEKVKSGGGIKFSNIPGQKIVLNLRIGSNSTIANRSVDDVVPTAEQETLTTAQFEWGSMTGSVSFRDSQFHDNMGKAELVPILEPALDQLADTWMDRLSQNLLSETSADSAFQFLGVKDAVTDATWTHPSDYGGLTPALYSTWAGYVKNNTGVLANLVDDMNNVYNTVSFSTQKPDIILTDQKGEELYRSAMDTNIRYTDTKVGDGTINAVTFRGIPVWFDRDVTGITSTPSGPGTKTWSGTTDTATTHRFYFINSDSWEFIWDSDWNMNHAVESGWRVPTNQFSKTKLCALRGQLVCKQRKYNGLLVNVPES